MASNLLPCLEAPRSHSRSSSHSSLDEALPSQPKSKEASASSTAAGSVKIRPLINYSVYMASVLPKQMAVSPAVTSPMNQSPQSSPGADKKVLYNVASHFYNLHFNTPVMPKHLWLQSALKKSIPNPVFFPHKWDFVILGRSFHADVCLFSDQLVSNSIFDAIRMR